mmetsp:Transcript_9377/g.26357  ORF Transcript_9377/g.26357 Transcript_9377/m.26357 type:complete len:327 (+) Transcript_9377:113-1093(+)
MGDSTCGEEEEYVWRFGYGSNIGLSTLQTKKNLHPKRFLVGSIKGWSLYFQPGIPFVEPGFAAIHPVGDEGDGDDQDDELHGSAFLIPRLEAVGLDEQERGYHALPSKFVAYDGEVVDGVGLYVPKKYVVSGNVQKDITLDETKHGTPSLRYLNLLRNGAREAGLCDKWIGKLDSFHHYETPEDIRSKTMEWIEDFHADTERNDTFWTMEKLSKHDGSDPENYPAHVCVMEFVVQVGADTRTFPSWKGHCVTRRNLVHLRGLSIDKNDIRWNEDGFRPLPDLACCSEKEKEYLLQNLETLLHRGGRIVARLKEHLEDQDFSRYTLP